MSFFGKNIRKIRSVKTLSQQAFAELFDLKRGTLGAYEEGRSEPKIETIITIANYFSIPIDDLLTRELTVNELLKFKSSLTEQFEVVATERFPAIPCITDTNASDYLQFCEKESFIEDMVSLALPVESEAELRGYVIQSLEMSNQDQGLFPKDLVIGERVKIPKLDKLGRGEMVLVMTKSQLILRRLYKQGNQLVLRADHKKVQEISIDQQDVCELWRIIAVFQKRIPEVTNGIEEKLLKLEEEFAKLRGKL